MKKSIETTPINHYIYIPKNNNKEPLPILLYLHGIGERGNNLINVEKYGLPKYLKNETINLPYIIIIPQCESNNFWDYHLRDIEKILKNVAKQYNGDLNKVALLGTSMGAFGAWNYIMQRPKMFKCLISVSGGSMLPIDINLNNIKDKSFLIYHGDKDDIINVSKSYEIYDRLDEIDANDIELKIIQGDNHFLSSHAFKDKYMYEWLESRL